MPAIYAHRRFGEETAKGLNPTLQAVVTKYPEAFMLGTQGPDVLFYHKPLKRNETRLHGTNTHAKSGKAVFDNMHALWVEQGKKEDAFLAYLCGYLCHFTLDALCHKYIDEHSTSAVTHGKIESEFDKFMLRKDGFSIRSQNTAKFISGKNGCKQACALAMGVDEKKIARSIKTMRKINGMFSSRVELFHSFAHFVLRLAKMERKFGDMFLHKKDEPLCKQTNLDLIEKWQTGIPVAREIVETFFGADNPTQNELFRYNFSGIIKEN